ncbi:hypothetical protein [Streptomyces sp. NBC_00035]|uniref:hypothetical protein n=1 Tax=Streptomyces sp. NBC_00035 TaxID=2903614 RepID=UPI003248F979
MSSRLYARAGQAYEQAGLPLEAARCYGAAGEHRRAADLLVRMGEYSAAVEEYRRAEQLDVAAWILVHHLADPVAARFVIERHGDQPTTAWRVLHGSALRISLVMARCNLAEGGGPRDVLPVLGAASDSLENPDYAYDPFVEQWAVAIAEYAGRFDQVALLFAASVRGHRLGSTQRWQEWSRRVLGMELSIPPPDQRAADSLSLSEREFNDFMENLQLDSFPLDPG